MVDWVAAGLQYYVVLRAHLSKTSRGLNRPWGSPCAFSTAWPQESPQPDHRRDDQRLGIRSGHLTNDKVAARKISVVVRKNAFWILFLVLAAFGRQTCLWNLRPGIYRRRFTHMTGARLMRMMDTQKPSPASSPWHAVFGTRTVTSCLKFAEWGCSRRMKWDTRRRPGYALFSRRPFINLRSNVLLLAGSNSFLVYFEIVKCISLFLGATFAMMSLEEKARRSRFYWSRRGLHNSKLAKFTC